MPPIPRNNLIDRLEKLGYNAKNVNINPPQMQIIINIPNATATTSMPKAKPIASLKDNGPVIVNVDDWSDFEDD